MNNVHIIPANVQIYINNDSDEIINVHTMGKFIPMLLARLLPGDEQLLKIERGTKIYINSENTKRISLEIICDEDEKIFNIY